MINLISLFVTLVIMSLFGIGLLMMLIIMGHSKSAYEEAINKEEEQQYIKDWQFKKQQKKEARRNAFNNFKAIIKKIFTRR